MPRMESFERGFCWLILTIFAWWLLVCAYLILAPIGVSSRDLLAAPERSCGRKLKGVNGKYEIVGLCLEGMLKFPYLQL